MCNKQIAIALLMAITSVANGSDTLPEIKSTNQQPTQEETYPAPYQYLPYTSADKSTYFYAPYITIKAIRHLIGEYARHEPEHISICMQYTKEKEHVHWPIDQTKLETGTFTFAYGGDPRENYAQIQTAERKLNILVRRTAAFAPLADDYLPLARYRYDANSATGQAILDKKNGTGNQIVCFEPYIPGHHRILTRFLQGAGLLPDLTNNCQK